MARAAADNKGIRDIPPVRGSGLAEADALIISSSIALALDIALADAVALDIAVAEALPMALALPIMSSSSIIMSSSPIIWSSCIFATAAGAKTSATSKDNAAARANLLMFPPSYLWLVPTRCTGARRVWITGREKNAARRALGVEGLHKAPVLARALSQSLDCKKISREISSDPSSWARSSARRLALPRRKGGIPARSSSASLAHGIPAG